MSKHTRFKWTIVKTEAPDYVEIRTPDHSQLLANVFQNGSGHFANARLIAAAPEMLAALKHVVEKIGCNCEETFTGEVVERRFLCAIHVAEIAIAKAEGTEK